MLGKTMCCVCHLFHNQSSPMCSQNNLVCVLNGRRLRREAFECLEGVRIVIAGDSIMRQLFNMAITMFRGQVKLSAILSYT